VARPAAQTQFVTIFQPDNDKHFNHKMELEAAGNHPPPMAGHNTNFHTIWHNHLPPLNRKSSVSHPLSPVPIHDVIIAPDHNHYVELPLRFPGFHSPFFLFLPSGRATAGKNLNRNWDIMPPSYFQFLPCKKSSAFCGNFIILKYLCG